MIYIGLKSRSAKYAYRDEKGKSQRTQAMTGEEFRSDMKYQEWKNKYVIFEDIPNVKNEVIKMSLLSFEETLSKTKGNKKMVELLNKYSEDIEYQIDTNKKSAFAYRHNDDLSVESIVYNPYSEDFEYIDIVYAITHELSHRADFHEIHSWKHERFIKAAETCYNKAKENIETIENWFKDGEKYCEDIALSDIFSALSRGEFNKILIGGHSDKYWLKNPDSVYTEIFAEISSIDITESASKAEFNDILKELYEAYEEMLK